MRVDRRCRRQANREGQQQPWSASRAAVSMAAMQTVCRCAMAWAPAAWTAARCSTLVARLLERGFARRECNGSEKSEVGSLRPTAEKNIMDGKHIAMVATPIVLLCVTAFLLRKSKPGREKARVSYTKRADGGRVAGRTVDKELWSRLIPAFAKLPISAAEVARLQDADDPHQVQVLNSRTLQPPPTVSTHGSSCAPCPAKSPNGSARPAKPSLGAKPRGSSSRPPVL